MVFGRRRVQWPLAPPPCASPGGLTPPPASLPALGRTLCRRLLAVSVSAQGARRPYGRTALRLRPPLRSAPRLPTLLIPRTNCGISRAVTGGPLVSACVPRPCSSALPRAMYFLAVGAALRRLAVDGFVAMLRWLASSGAGLGRGQKMPV